MKEKLKRQKEELENENKIMKKKHLTGVKELNKELISLRKKVEQNEQNQSTNGQQHNTANQQHQSQETISLSSRTNSSNSLERTPNGLVIDHHLNANNYENLPSNNSTSFNHHNQILNPNFANSSEIAQQIDKNVLLNKILALQNQLGKLRSRIEFLEEHNTTLLEDLKKKSKLIQNFILREEAGALSSNEMDSFKVKKDLFVIFNSILC